MKIALLEPLGVSGQKINELSEAFALGGHDFTYYDNRTEETDELIKRAEGADAVILSNLPFRKNVIGECKNLKMISIAFTGVDHVDVEYCKQRGILVKNAAGYSTASVAELAFGMIISLLRNMAPCDAAVRSGKTKDGLIGNDLCGKTLGIIGFGAIGSKMFEIGKAFGCEILIHTRTAKPEYGSAAKFTDLDSLLTHSDIVSLHTPLSDSTKGLISKEKLALMKPSALLINTARGPIVDYEALAKALKEGKLAGAGIDVFEAEPPLRAAHPLLSAPNTILAPHVGFATKEALERRADIAFDNIYQWLER